MDYLDLYKSRMAVSGSTFADKMDIDAEDVYNSYMKNRDEVATINLIDYKIALIHDKENEVLEQYIVLADLDSPFMTGTIFEIDCIFYIIIYKEETRHNKYFKGVARKCTDLIKIKTNLGTTEYRAYVEGVNGINMKRTENNDIVFDDNKASGKVILKKDSNFAYIEPIKTRFFIGEEVYVVTGKNSLAEMGYLTVEKDKINTFKDNKVLGIANYYDVKEQDINYYISAVLIDGVELEKDIEYEIEDILEIRIENSEGNLISETYTLDAVSTEININGSKITPLVLGNLKLYLNLDNDSNSRAEIVLSVLKESVINYDYTGNEELIWSEEDTYVLNKLISDVIVPSTWTFSIDSGNNLVTLVAIDDNSYTLTANENGLVGMVVIKAINGTEVVYRKVIVKSWWN